MYARAWDRGSKKAENLHTYYVHSPKEVGCPEATEGAEGEGSGGSGAGSGDVSASGDEGNSEASEAFADGPGNPGGTEGAEVDAVASLGFLPRLSLWMVKDSSL